MAFAGRGFTPQNFIDSVSLGMRLPTPVPAFLFARAALAGRALAGLDAGQTTMQQFKSMSGDGESVSPDLDIMIRSGEMYPDAVITVDEIGKGIGDTVKFRRDIFSGGGYDLGSRLVKPGNPTSTTGQAFSMEEVPITLQEFEGPYNATASAVQPYEIREFDAMFRKNRDKLVDLVTRQLVFDYTKWLDTVIRDLFRATSNITFADDVAGANPATQVFATGVGAFTANAGHGASLDMLLKTRKALSDREWKHFPNGKYMCLVPTAFNVQMVGDPDWRALSAYQAPGKNLLFGYITSVQDMDVFECTTLKTYNAGDAVPDGLGNTTNVPSGATVYEGLLIGPGGAAMGTGQEPECRFADDTDYGKAARVIWNAKQAFSAVDNRAVQRFLFQA